MAVHDERADFISTLPGFKLATEAITPDEEARAIALVEGCKPQRYPGDGLAFLRGIAARFADLAPEAFVQCLLNRYESGAEIPWHCDKPIWEDVIGVSLGSQTTMHFRRPATGGYEYGKEELTRRSMYLLSGDIRKVFDHAIPPVKETRWSITFRTLSEEGRKLRDAVGRGNRPRSPT